MNFIQKFLADKVALPADKAIVNQLIVNRTVNITILESDVAAGVATIESAVTNLVISKIKASPLVSLVIQLVDSELLPQIPAALVGVENTIPAKYDALVALLQKDEQYF
jgi:hypothetical protein